MKENLKTLWETLKKENPKMRIREAANKLNVSELELLSTNIGSSAIVLKPDCKEILKEVHTLGYVMALTRNEDCVHERKGIYKNISFESPHIGLAVNPDIDLRIFIGKWNFAFAIIEDNRKSLQFFSKNGTAIHKIYLTDKSNIEAYNNLVDKYKDPNQNTEINIIKDENTTDTTKPIADIDIVNFQKEWTELKDTHDFFLLLKKFGVSRTQALRLAPEGYAQQISIDSMKDIFKQISQKEAEIMVFVGNEGIIQIHTGKSSNILETGKWFNILDDEFNMHLNEDAIDNIWLVKKPTDDVQGEKTIIHSIEAYNKDNQLIVQIFGKRKPGIPESILWREILNPWLEKCDTGAC
ncbi:MAG: hemin-degrading factor [Solitalea-like symbiont of Tyrophagus putrescentiae]